MRIQGVHLADPCSGDQGVFNRLMTSGLYPVRAASADGAIIHGPDGLRLAPLPADRFCSGHLVWVQQRGEVRDCVSVHATFTEYGDAGKRWRFLEAGLWALLPPTYYEEGRYLTFVPPDPPPDPMPCAAGAAEYRAGHTPPVCGGEDPHHGLPPKRFGNIHWSEGMKRSARLRANHELMGRQVAAATTCLAGTTSPER